MIILLTILYTFLQPLQIRTQYPLQQLIVLLYQFGTISKRSYFMRTMLSITVCTVYTQYFALCETV